MNNNISAVILAGGTNKRFGGVIKANAVIDGKTIISRAIDILKDIFDEIIIVTNTPGEFEKYKNCNITGDHYSGIGPLGGIHAAMKTSSGDAVFVFAGDMPFLNKDLILKQIEFYKNHKYDILLPKVNQNIEPLHAIYDLNLVERLEKYLKSDQNNAVREFLKLVNVGYMQIEDSEESKRAFTNINSPSDIVF